MRTHKLQSPGESLCAEQRENMVGGTTKFRPVRPKFFNENVSGSEDDAMKRCGLERRDSCAADVSTCGRTCCEQYDCADRQHRHLADADSSELERRKGRSPTDYPLCPLELNHCSSLTCHLRLAFPNLPSSSRMKCTLRLPNGWPSFGLSLLFSLLLVTDTYAYPLAGNTDSNSDNLLTTSPGTSYSSNDILLMRQARGANTPASRGTSPQKRQAGDFRNTHDNPQRLASRSGFYIEIRKNGKVKGTRKQNAYSALEFTSIRTGVVAIKGLKTNRYLAMDNKGKLVGLKTYTPACNFHEGLVENNFFVFYQERQVVGGPRKKSARQLYVAFDNRGRPKRGKKVQRLHAAAHFQKLKATAPKRKKPRRKKRPKVGTARRRVGTARRRGSTARRRGGTARRPRKTKVRSPPRT